ncbi:tigger transposable element-derived protein 6-like [Condylostylus longicornis]|uniref:tigger transposable element-derived protein 6-like n=1 Tax=Condylostylus longicornis TaxID=2530218 RepID=UPI00244E2D2F|nr:tigger transposable element-derived protein 6-like [Condylostylus longicornis]
MIREEKNLIEKSKIRKVTTKRIRNGACFEVEQALLIWFNRIRESGGVISANMLMEKAKQFAIQMNKDFNPSRGWLWRWQKRENILFKKIQGESNSADYENANNYTETLLPNLISNYDAENIFNADETSLFFKALPTSTLSKTKDPVKGFKSLKERLTLLFICNLTGDYKKVIAIGKPKNPRCFKNKILPIQYYSQNKAWMVGSIWEDILTSLEEEMEKNNRKIILFVDNAGCHKTSRNFSNINIQFLPLNTTSITQPLDQGIIRCFKVHYRQNILRKQIAAIEREETLAQFSKNINLFHALHMVKRAWWLSKFIPSNAPIIENSNEDCENFNEDCLMTDFDFGGLMERNEFDGYVAIDEEIECYGQPNDQEIIQEVSSIGLDEDLETTSDNETETYDAIPTIKDVLNGINIVRKFFIPQNKFIENLDEMETFIIKNHYKHNQTKITNFFK